jgi:hypothetical protein
MNRVFEVRSSQELAAQLAKRPCDIVCLEVRRTRLAETLAWLAENVPVYPKARFVALIDGNYVEAGAAADVSAALLAAGAIAVADSPRRLQCLLGVGQRHEAAQAIESQRLSENQTFAERAWSRLPWQATSRQVG